MLVYFTRVLDGSYICGIRQGYTLYGHESKRLVEVAVPSSMAAFIFTLGTYGLRKLDFLTDPDSTRGSAMNGTEFIGIVPRPAAPLCVDIEWDVRRSLR
jgi:hypothetical protein